jgi:hypothetical protein
MGDNRKSSDAVIQSSTGYSLKSMFMFISYIIINIIMINYCLNIHTCTWIVSLTIILKCLLNYGIKIYQNVVYYLTIYGIQWSSRPGRTGRQRQQVTLHTQPPESAPAAAGCERIASGPAGGL